MDVKKIKYIYIFMLYGKFCQAQGPLSAPD